MPTCHSRSLMGWPMGCASETLWDPECIKRDPPALTGLDFQKCLSAWTPRWNRAERAPIRSMAPSWFTTSWIPDPTSNPAKNSNIYTNPIFQFWTFYKFHSNYTGFEVSGPPCKPNTSHSSFHQDRKTTAIDECKRLHLGSHLPPSSKKTRGMFIP